MRVDQLWLKERRAKSLGQTVHEKELGLRLGCAKLVDGIRGNPASGVRHRAKARNGSGSEGSQSKQLEPERRPTRQHCYRLFAQRSKDLQRQRRALDYQPRARAHRAEQLVEAVVETERQK